MAAMSHIRVLLVDDDQQFCSYFTEELESNSDSLNFGIEYTDHVNGNHGGRDLYICTQKVNNTEECLAKIKHIREQEPIAPIFVIAEIKDFGFMKKLIDLNIAGYIDKDQLDLSRLLNEAKTIHETRLQVSRMVNKLNQLDALSSVT